MRRMAGAHGGAAAGLAAAVPRPPLHASDEEDTEGASSPLSLGGDSAPFNPLAVAHNSVRAGLGSGLDGASVSVSASVGGSGLARAGAAGAPPTHVRAASAVAHSPEYPPSSYALMALQSSVPPAEMMQVGGLHASDAARARARRHAAAAAGVDYVPETVVQPSPRPVPPASSSSSPSGVSGVDGGKPAASVRTVHGRDKPLHGRRPEQPHRRNMSFASSGNSALGGLGLGMGLGMGLGVTNKLAPETRSVSFGMAATAATAASAFPSVSAAKPVSSARSSGSSDGSGSGSGGGAQSSRGLDSMVKLMHTISSLKRWKSRSIASVDRALDALRAQASAFLAHAHNHSGGGGGGGGGGDDVGGFGPMVSHALDLCAAPARAIAESRGERLAIASSPLVRLEIAPGAAPPSLYRQGDLAHYSTVSTLQRMSNAFNEQLLVLVKKLFDSCCEQAGLATHSSSGGAAAAASAATAAAAGFVGKSAYIHCLLLLHRALMPATSAQESVRIVLDDWGKDSRAWGARIPGLASTSTSASTSASTGRTALPEDGTTAAAAPSPRAGSAGTKAAAGTGSTDAKSIAAAAAIPDSELGFNLAAFHACIFQLVDHWTVGCAASEYVSLLGALVNKVTAPTAIAGDDVQPASPLPPRGGGAGRGGAIEKRKHVFVLRPLTSEYAKALEAAMNPAPAAAAPPSDRRRRAAAAASPAPDSSRTKARPASRGGNGSNGASISPSRQQQQRRNRGSAGEETRRAAVAEFLGIDPSVTVVEENATRSSTPGSGKSRASSAASSRFSFNYVGADSRRSSFRSSQASPRDSRRSSQSGGTRAAPRSSVSFAATGASPPNSGVAAPAAVASALPSPALPPSVPSPPMSPRTRARTQQAQAQAHVIDYEGLARAHPNLGPMLASMSSIGSMGAGSPPGSPGAKRPQQQPPPPLSPLPPPMSPRHAPSPSTTLSPTAIGAAAASADDKNALRRSLRREDLTGAEAAAAAAAALADAAVSSIVQRAGPLRGPAGAGSLSVVSLGLPEGGAEGGTGGASSRRQQRRRFKGLLAQRNAGVEAEMERERSTSQSSRGGSVPSSRQGRRRRQGQGQGQGRGGTAETSSRHESFGGPSAPLPLSDVEKRRLQLEAESSALSSPKSALLRRLPSVPYDPLSRLSAADTEPGGGGGGSGGGGGVGDAATGAQVTRVAPRLVGPDGRINYELLDPRIAALLQRHSVSRAGSGSKSGSKPVHERTLSHSLSSPSVAVTAEEEEALIGAELHPLEGDESYADSAAARAAASRRRQAEAARRAALLARLERGEGSGPDSDQEALERALERSRLAAERRAIAEEEWRRPLPLLGKRVATQGTGTGVAASAAPGGTGDRAPGHTEDGAPATVDLAASDAGAGAGAGADAATDGVASSAPGLSVLTTDTVSALPAAATTAATPTASKPAAAGTKKRAAIPLHRRKQSQAFTASTAASVAAGAGGSDGGSVISSSIATDPAVALAQRKANAAAPRVSAATQARLANKKAVAAVLATPSSSRSGAASRAAAARTAGSSISPVRSPRGGGGGAGASSGVKANEAWFAHMRSLGREPLLAAALSRADQVASQAQEALERAGVPLPPKGDVELDMNLQPLGVEEENGTEGEAAVDEQTATGGGATQQQQHRGPLATLRASPGGLSRARLELDFETDPTEDSAYDRSVAAQADSIASMVERAADQAQAEAQVGRSLPRGTGDGGDQQGAEADDDDDDDRSPSSSPRQRAQPRPRKQKQQQQQQQQSQQQGRPPPLVKQGSLLSARLGSPRGAASSPSATGTPSAAGTDVPAAELDGVLLVEAASLNAPLSPLSPSARHVAALERRESIALQQQQQRGQGRRHRRRAAPADADADAEELDDGDADGDEPPSPSSSGGSGANNGAESDRDADADADEEGEEKRDDDDGGSSPFDHPHSLDDLQPATYSSDEEDEQQEAGEHGRSEGAGTGQTTGTGTGTGAGTDPARQDAPAGSEATTAGAPTNAIRAVSSADGQPQSQQQQHRPLMPTGPVTAPLSLADVSAGGGLFSSSSTATCAEAASDEWAEQVGAYFEERPLQPPASDATSAAATTVATKRRGPFAATAESVGLPRAATGPRAPQRQHVQQHQAQQQHRQSREGVVRMGSTPNVSAAPARMAVTSTSSPRNGGGSNGGGVGSLPAAATVIGSGGSSARRASTSPSTLPASGTAAVPAGAASPSSTPLLSDSAVVETRQALHMLSSRRSRHSNPAALFGPQQGAGTEEGISDVGRSQGQGHGHGHGGPLPLDLSREILHALRALRPVDSLPVAPTLRPASAVAQRPLGSRRSSSRRGSRGAGAEAASPRSLRRRAAAVADSDAQTHVATPMDAVSSTTAARCWSPVRRWGRERQRPASSAGLGLLGPAPPAQPSIQTLAAAAAASHAARAALLRGPDEALAIIDAGLEAARRNNHAHQAQAQAQAARQRREGTATAGDGSRSASPMRQQYSAHAPSRAGATIAAQAPLPLASVSSLQAAVSMTTATAASGPALPSPSGFAVAAAHLPLPPVSAAAPMAVAVSAPRDPVHLSSGEVLQGWAEEAHETLAPSAPPGVPGSPRPPGHYGGKMNHSGGNGNGNGSAVLSQQPRAPFDVARGVSEAFESIAAPAKLAPSAAPSNVAPVSATVTAADGPPSSIPSAADTWNHSSTLADDFEWRMPECRGAPRRPGPGGRRPSRRQQQQQQQQALGGEGAFVDMPTRKGPEETFSALSHSRTLRLVVDQAKARAQAQAAAEAETHARAQQGSSYTAEGAIAGWSSSAPLAYAHAPVGEEKQSHHPSAVVAVAASVAARPLSLAAGPTPPPYAALSPYLAQPNPSAAAASSPHEVHSAQFAALAASFNASARGSLTLPAARPKTAERWAAAAMAPPHVAAAAAAGSGLNGASGASTARPSSSVRDHPRPMLPQAHTARVRSRPRSNRPVTSISTVASGVVSSVGGLGHQSPAAAAFLPPSPWPGQPSVPTIPRSRPQFHLALDGIVIGGSGGGASDNRDKDGRSLPMSPASSLAAGLHERAAAAAAAAASTASHWSSTVPLSIPAPESSRFLYAAPFHSPHAQAAMHAAMGSGPSQAHGHGHALGPHESVHAYPPANVALAGIGGGGGVSGYSSRPSASGPRSREATASSHSLALTGRSRRVWRDATPSAAESIVAAAVSPFHTIAAGSDARGGPTPASLPSSTAGTQA